MYVVPFIRVSQRSPGLQQVWLFLERNGGHLIEIDCKTPEDAVKHASEFAEVNGFNLLAEPFCVDGVVYCPVDAATPDLTNFYTWKETPVGTTPPREVWRTFLWASSTENLDPWGVNRLMDDIKLSEQHTAYSVLKGVLDLKA
jgi:hypothetical protein